MAAGTLVTVTMVRARGRRLTANWFKLGDDRLGTSRPHRSVAGSWTVNVLRFTIPAGNPGTVAQTLTIDGTPPVVTITGGSTALTNDSTPALAGTTSDGTVAVAIDGQAVSGVVVDGNGWTVPYPSSAAGTQRWRPPHCGDRHRHGGERHCCHPDIDGRRDPADDCDRQRRD